MRECVRAYGFVSGNRQYIPRDCSCEYYATGEWSRFLFQLGNITKARTFEAEGSETDAAPFLDADWYYEFGKQWDFIILHAVLMK